MIQVFRTNVNDPSAASLLLHRIHEVFPQYEANFDLDDMDRILRVKSASGYVHEQKVIELVIAAGYLAVVLPDSPPASSAGKAMHSFSPLFHSRGT